MNADLIKAANLLREAGFNLKSLTRDFIHPCLTVDGTPISPSANGFHQAMKAGKPVYERVLGEFVISVESANAADPAEDWFDCQVTVAKSTAPIVSLTGYGWLQVVSGAEFVGQDQGYLSNWYLNNVGYDPVAEEPNIGFAELVSSCEELALINNCGGVDSAAYLSIEGIRARED